MQTSSLPVPANITVVDLQLASAYYPILVDVARQKLRVTYSELVERAKTKYPGRADVQKAIPVSTGRRLDVVRLFTSERDLPDLTSLVISKGTGECGAGFTRSFDPVAVREQVFAFDWTKVATEFDGFTKATEKSIAPRKRVKEPQALELMSAYYMAHKDTLPSSIRDHRELIVELIMEGLPPEAAFSQAASDHQ